MPGVRFVIIAIGLVVAATVAPDPASAAAAAGRTCLNAVEQRAAISTGRALPLAKVHAMIRGHRRQKGDIIRARLCEGPDGLVYLLTLLSRNGKVSRLTVDAAKGTVINRR